MVEKTFNYRQVDCSPQSRPLIHPNNKHIDDTVCMSQNDEKDSYEKDSFCVSDESDIPQKHSSDECMSVYATPKPKVKRIKKRRRILCNSQESPESQAPVTSLKSPSPILIKKEISLKEKEVVCTSCNLPIISNEIACEYCGYDQDGSLHYKYKFCD